MTNAQPTTALGPGPPAVGLHRHDEGRDGDHGLRTVNRPEYPKYFDRATVQVKFLDGGLEELDETWFLDAEAGELDTEWLLDEVVHLSHQAPGCCGGGTYDADVRERRAEWGASGAVLDILLSLPADLVSNSVWAGLGVVADRVVRRLRRKPDYALPQELDESAAQQYALGVLEERFRVPQAEVLVTSIGTTAEGRYAFIFDSPAITFHVEVMRLEGVVTLAKIRRDFK